MGAYGQLCPLNSITKQCRFIGDFICEPYDCCMCDSIDCGVGNSASCSLFEVGKNGIFGIKDVQINGNNQELNGVVINCRGDESCKESLIHANNVNVIDCNGMKS